MPTRSGRGRALALLLLALHCCTTRAGDWLVPGPRRATLDRCLFGCSIVNPIVHVVANDYTARMQMLGLSVPLLLPDRRANTLTAQAYNMLFYFARLKPRVLFTIGSLLRALQMTTPIQYVFDPEVGIGTGCNLLCLFAGGRWPSVIVLGWAVSKHFWAALGSRPPPPRAIPVFHANGMCVNVTEPTWERPLPVDARIKSIRCWR